MENRARKDLLIELTASLAGLALTIYSLATVRAPDTFRMITAIAGVGVFLFGSIRYGVRFRQLQKKQKG